MCYGNYNSMFMMNPMSMMNFGSINPFMGMMGGFGCGSIWNMYGGYNNGCCDVDYNAMAGWGVANAVLSIGGMAIVSAIQNKKANQGPSLQDQYKAKDAEVKAELKKLGSDVNESNYSTYQAKDEPDFVSKQKEITDVIAEQKGIIRGLEADPNYKNRGQIQILRDEIANLKTTDPNYDTIKEQKTKELNDALEIQRKIDAANKEIEEKEKAQKELDKKIAARQKEIDAIVNNVKTLIKERDAIGAKIQAEADEKTMEKADGCALTRTSDKQFSKIYNFENGTFGTKKDGSQYSAADLTSPDLRHLINKYKEGNAEEKAQIKKFLADHIDQIRDSEKRGCISEGLKLILS